MQITKNKVVSFDYQLTDEQGTVLDHSEAEAPLQYLHGTGSIISGLEQSLDGRTVGEVFSVTLAPENAYGDRNEDLSTAVDRSHFDDFDDLELGMQFRVPTDEGEHRVVTIVEIDEQSVTIDANHPLAGVTLVFQITVRDIRDATDEEIRCGHLGDLESDEH